jgi:phage FluMu gp28-like protein
MSPTRAAAFEANVRKAKQDPAYFAKVFLGIEPFPYQVDFLRDGGQQIAAACGRQVGKTTLAAIKGLHFAFFNRGVTVLVVSSTLRQSMLLFAKIRSTIETNPIVRLKLKSSTRTTIEFDHGSRIVALPCGPTGYSLRGYTSDMIIIDEANFVPEEVVDGVIRPMLITRPNSRFIMLSTPWGKSHPFYRAVSEKEQGYHVYSWATRLNPLVSAEKLEAERNEVDESTFRREYEAQFTEETNCYFPRHLILQCVDENHELLKDEDVLQRTFKGEFHLGVDFGKRVDYTALAVIQRLDDEKLRIAYLKQLPLGSEYASAIGWIKRLVEAFNFVSCTLDQTGVGEAPAEDVKRVLPQTKGVILTTKMKVDLLSNLLILMEHKRLILPLDRALIAEINAQQYTMARTGELLFSHPAKSHDDQLWALALAAWQAKAPAGKIMSVKRPL